MPILVRFRWFLFLVGWLEQESRKLSRVNNNKGQSLPSCGPQAAQSEQGLALLGLSRVDLALLGPPGEQESLKLCRVNKQGSVPTASPPSFLPPSSLFGPSPPHSHSVTHTQSLTLTQTRSAKSQAPSGKWTADPTRPCNVVVYTSQ